MGRAIGLAILVMMCGLGVSAQDQPAAGWKFGIKFELRANYRDSNDEFLNLRAKFPPEFLQPGQTVGQLRTVDPGSHGEVSLGSLMFDTSYESFFAARVRVDAVDLYNRNPTSGDKQVDLDELWFRFGEKPEGLERPVRSTLFAQLGKAPKMERVPFRLLESYGLATNAFNRFNDAQLLVGGTVGSSFYWRAQYSSGNPVFFRDTNSLAGDNGVKELMNRPPNPEYQSGFPIFYDAEVESEFFDTDNPETGFGLGYRWQSEDQRAGFDIIVYDYRRDLAETVDLEGTFYGGDLDLFTDGFGTTLWFLDGKKRSETGTRLYAELLGGTLIGQYVKQDLAGLERNGAEVEAGWRFDLNVGPVMSGRRLISSIQPAIRYSVIDNEFAGPPTYVAPSVWWDWHKIDAGLRIGFLDGKVDLTAEQATHTIQAAKKLDIDETLVTLRIRM